MQEEKGHVHGQVYMGIEVDANDVDANPNADRSGWAAAEARLAFMTGKPRLQWPWHESFADDNSSISGMSADFFSFSPALCRCRPSFVFFSGACRRFPAGSPRQITFSVIFALELLLRFLAGPLDAEEPRAPNGFGLKVKGQSCQRKKCGSPLLNLIHGSGSRPF